MREAHPTISADWSVGPKVRLCTRLLRVCVPNTATVISSHTHTHTHTSLLAFSDPL